MIIGKCKVCGNPLHVAWEDYRDMVMDNVVTIEMRCGKCGSIHEMLDPGGSYRLVTAIHNKPKGDTGDKAI